MSELKSGWEGLNEDELREIHESPEITRWSRFYYYKSALLTV